MTEFEELFYLFSKKCHAFSTLTEIAAEINWEPEKVLNVLSVSEELNAELKKGTIAVAAAYVLHYRKNYRDKLANTFNVPSYERVIAEALRK